MTAKEYLNQAYIIDRRIDLTLAKAKKLRESLYGKSQQIDDVGVKGGGSNDRLGEAVCKVIEYEQKADELIDSLVEARLKIEKTIQAVPDPVQREVLERRYLLFQDWESHFDTKTGEYIKGIAGEMNYSARQIYRIHGEALKCVSVNVSEWQSKK